MAFLLFLTVTQDYHPRREEVEVDTNRNAVTSGGETPTITIIELETRIHANTKFLPTGAHSDLGADCWLGEGRVVGQDTPRPTAPRLITGTAYYHLNLFSYLPFGHLRS